MNNFLRGVVPAFVKAHIKRMIGRPMTRLHTEWKILEAMGPTPTPHVILDIGAHNGWFFHCWQDWCPAAEVHAFEPYPESFEAMRHLYGADPRVTLNQIGVGARPGELSFNVFGASKVSNSFLAPVEEAWNTLHYDTGSISKILVPITTIDDYIGSKKMNTIRLAKIDVQGYELQVLEGARNSLSQIDHILIEAGIERLYEGAPRFSDVFEFLQDHGFHLMSMRAWHRGNHVLMETDMLFRRNGLAPPVDDSVIKVMESVG
jgi:FkbM family methyltransferase